MDAARAISSVVERIQSHGLDYPVTDLTADRFYGGWCVYAPALIADGDENEDLDVPVTRSVFLVGESGRVEEVESSAPVAEAREWFAEACIWFSAQEPDLGTSDSALPSNPDFSGLARPRQPADYDREVVAVLARALTHERDFSGWLADRLRDLADLVGGSSRLIARRPRSWAARHVRELTEPHADDDPAGAWRTWPSVDPASLPDADITGWLLVPVVRTVEILEGLESSTPAATRLADVIADRARQAPPWRACGVAELTPQLVAVRRGDLRDADVDTLRRLAAEDGAEDVLDKLLVPPAGADIEALLRLAVDADRHHRTVIDLDAAATAAYRRVLDHLELPFENYWLEAMFE
jgi:hypothetical protein